MMVMPTPVSGTAANLISATVIRVLTSGEGGTPWRGIVMPTGEGRPIFLRIDVPPPELRAGDDVHLCAPRINSGDLSIPDEVHVRATDADGRISAMVQTKDRVVAFEPSTSQAVPLIAGEIASALGMAALAQAATGGLVSLGSRSGVVGVVRSRQSADPAIAWALKRFSDPDTDGMRGAFTMIVEPSALIARRTKASSLQSIQRAAASLRTIAVDFALCRDVSNEALETEYYKRTSSVASAMPAFMNEKFRSAAAVDTVNVRPTHRLMGDYHEEDMRPPDLVIPLDPTLSGMEHWQDMSAAWSGFCPREVTPPLARAMLIVAHEMGHAYQNSFGYGYSTVAEKNAAESFSDAVAIISYVTDTGDRKSAQAHADMRSISALFGVQTHSTGPACERAIEEAERLKSIHGFSKVPLGEILEASRRISEISAHPTPTDLSLAHDWVSLNHPKFASLPLEQIAELFRTAVKVADGLVHRALTRDFIEAGLNALHISSFTRHEMTRPDVLKTALATQMKDIVETASNLAELGFGELVPKVVRRTLDRANAEMVEGGKLGIDRAEQFLSDHSLAAQGPRLSHTLPQLLGDSFRDVIRDVVKAAFSVANIGNRRTASGMKLAYEGHKMALRNIVSPSTVKASPSSLISVIPTSVQLGRTAFDMSVAERMRRLGELVWQEREAVVQLYPTGESVLSLRRQSRAIAWATRVESQTWAGLMRSEIGEQMSFLTQLASPRGIKDILAVEQPVRGRASAYTKFCAMAQKIAVSEDIAVHRRFLAGEEGAERMDWTGRDLRWMDLRAKAGLDLRHANLSGADFRDMDLSDIDFTGAVLDGAHFDGCKMNRTVLARASLRGASLEGVTGTRMNFRSADLSSAGLQGCVISDSNFRGAVLSDAVIGSSRFPRCSMDEHVSHHAGFDDYLAKPFAL